MCDAIEALERQPFLRRDLTVAAATRRFKDPFIRAMQTIQHGDSDFRGDESPHPRLSCGC